MNTTTEYVPCPCGCGDECEVTLTGYPGYADDIVFPHPIPDKDLVAFEQKAQDLAIEQATDKERDRTWGMIR